ncbi:hypothetical protein [uncultured Jatrophihabitans sp.]|uniref:hypothetical protein n=1 Tax=uncultured Jatrophihabitans sp. TaxID=1610747 RepID=UPI0035CC0B49
MPHFPPQRLVENRRVVAGRAWWDQSIAGQGVSRMRELDLDTHALALCAQQVLCTAPLVVAMSAVLQRTTGHNVSVVIARFFGLTQKSRHDLSLLFGRASPSISTSVLVLGLVTAVIFMTSVGAVQQRAFELIWTLPRASGVRTHFRLLLFAPAFTAFMVAVLLAGRIGRSVDAEFAHVGPVSIAVLQAALAFVFYWWTQFWLLSGRVSYRALLPGAVAVAVLTTVLVRLSRLIVPGQISWQVDAYGLIGAVFVLSVWLMVLSAVIFAGVLIGALVAERRTKPNAEDDALEPTPLTSAGLTSAAEEHAPTGS